MTNTETAALLNSTSRSSVGKRRLRTSVVIAAALIGGVVGGAGGFAMAAGPWQGGWMHGGSRLERMQRMVRGALDSVGATTVQEDKIHDIIATNFSDMKERGAQRQAELKQMIDLLRAPTIDRAAIEKLRSDEIAAFDARTTKAVGAIADAADQLSPDQRVKLADRMEAMAQHRHEMGGRWNRDGMGSPGARPMGRGPMDGHSGPEDGPDGAPDKG